MSGLALEESYNVLNTCGDGTTATLALNTARKFGDFAHDYGEGNGYGLFGNVQYGSNEYHGIHAYALSSYTVSPNTQGLLNVTQGSAVVTGTGTNFTALFPALTQYIGIPAQKTNAASCNMTLYVASVQSDTQLTLDSPWTCASTSGIDGEGYGWVAAPAADTNCAAAGGLKAQTCEGAPDPSLSHEVHALWSWLYWKTGNSKYKTWAQQTLGTDYGGPGGGPGTPTSPVGPYATGAVGNFAAALPSCAAPDYAPAPCGGAGPQNGLGKSYGFSAGAGNANNAFAYLVLGTSSGTATRVTFGKVAVSGNSR